MKATSLLNPQTLNLYAYCTNDPINRTDPNGLGLFSWIKKHWKIILVAVAIVIAVLLIPGAPGFLGSFFQHGVSVIISGGGAATEGGGMSTWLKIVLGGVFAAAIAGLGTYLQNRQNGLSASQLTGTRKDEYQRAKRKAKDALKNADCQKFLKGLGINPDDVAKALDKQKAFDGMTSTLSLDAAGLQKGNFLSVAGAFQAAKEDREKGFGSIFAVTAIEGGEKTRYHVYFSDLPITADTVLHEAVHSASLLDDDQLAKKAGVTSVPKGSSTSEEFNKRLAQACGL